MYLDYSPQPGVWHLVSSPDINGQRPPPRSPDVAGLNQIGHRKTDVLVLGGMSGELRIRTCGSSDSNAWQTCFARLFLPFSDHLCALSLTPSVAFIPYLSCSIHYAGTETFRDRDIQEQTHTSDITSTLNSYELTLIRLNSGWTLISVNSCTKDCEFPVNPWLFHYFWLFLDYFINLHLFHYLPNFQLIHSLWTNCLTTPYFTTKHWFY